MLTNTANRLQPRQPLMKHLILVLVSIFLALSSTADGGTRYRKYLPDRAEEAWVDSVMRSLSPDERIAQLIMIRSFSGREKRYYDSIAQIIRQYNIGGVCFFKGTPTTQAIASNQYQKSAKTPVLVAIDGEWGLGMRLDSSMSFPRQLALGSVGDPDLIYRMGIEIGRQLRRIGVHMNFAPVADVNNNPRNPVINFRSFGEDPDRVSRHSMAYIRGLQDAGVMAVAKHFPGHGDTNSDSHYTLPVIKKPLTEMQEIHLPPFKTAIDSGVAGIMVAHLAIPALDPGNNAISSLSPVMVNGLLINQMGFDGLVITDGLEMKAIADFVHRDSVEIKALLAGNDILLLPVSVPRALVNIRKAIAAGILPPDLIDEKCRKLLRYKYRAGLNTYKPVETRNVIRDNNTPEAELLRRQLIEASLTLVRNKNNLVPLQRPDTLQIATLTFGQVSPDIFHQRFDQYAKADHYYLTATANIATSDNLLRTLDRYDMVIVAIRRTTQNPSSNYGVSRQIQQFAEALSAKTRVVLIHFGNPYALAGFAPATGFESLLLAHSDESLTADLSVQALFGAIEVRGIMPVSVAGIAAAGEGLLTQPLGRLSYTTPEAVGVSSDWLRKADSIALDGIARKAFPGCRILVAIDGRVIYDKGLGFHTYDKNIQVQLNDVYDIASLTKITATTLALMRLSGEGAFDIDRKMSYYLPSLAATNKGNLLIREVLAHQARLQAWIPFYRYTLKPTGPDTTYYRTKPIQGYGIEVAHNLFLRSNYPGIMADTMARSKLRDRQQYLYSDLGFIWLKEAIEKITGEPYDAYLAKTFYKPLGMRSTVFNARLHMPLSRIVPTEQDKEFRMQLLHGYVHDPAAAMMGGVAGHAGLFSTAHDLATFMQMMLNGGMYAGIRYLDSVVVAEFTRTQFPLGGNRRALGFDKPDLKTGSNGPACLSVSRASYGHSGFTGTYAWADPANRMVYIFLSNRVHPSATPNLLSQLNIRQNIHEVFYEALQRRDGKIQADPTAVKR